MDSISLKEGDLVTFKHNDKTLTGTFVGPQDFKITIAVWDKSSMPFPVHYQIALEDIVEVKSNS